MQVSFTKLSQFGLEFEQGAGVSNLMVDISPSEVSYPFELEGK
jgi:hypothetical protein